MRRQHCALCTVSLQSMAEQQGIAWEDVLSAADASQSVVIQPLPPEELARLQEAAAAAPTAAAGA